MNTLKIIVQNCSLSMALLLYLEGFIAESDLGIRFSVSKVMFLPKRILYLSNSLALTKSLINKCFVCPLFFSILYSIKIRSSFFTAIRLTTRFLSLFEKLISPPKASSAYSIASLEKTPLVGTKVLSLESRDKTFLVEMILSSLIKPDLEVEKNWVKESEIRYKAYKEGKSDLISLEEFENRMSK